MTNTVSLALLGSGTTDYLAKSLVRACAGHHLSAEVYHSPYNQYNQDIFNKESDFYRSAPELTILCLEGKALFPEWYDLKAVMGGREQKLREVQSVLESLETLITEIHGAAATKIVVNNFRIPCFSPLGVLDNKYFPGLRDLISLLNYRLAEWAADKDYIYVFDYNAFAARIGESIFDDPKLTYATKTPISLKATAALAGEYMRYILPLKGRTKKCLVLDLDNTLWGGIAGEDGLAGVKLDVDGEGRSFYDFQKELLSLHDRGILLAIDSKNNAEDAMAIIEQHPRMVLKKDHFSVMKINWRDKVKNLIEIAAELNIGTDSLVFFDDSIVERELVKALLPEVFVVDVPADTSKYADTIRNLAEFEQLKLTEEDLHRNAMVAGNKKRDEAQKKFADVGEYLKSLQTKVILEFSNDFNIPRIAQLTQKTNQFNMTTKRYSQEEIEAFHRSAGYLVASIQVTDIYGDNGVTGVCIVKLNGGEADIDTFLLSCRVMGRNVEYAFLRRITELLRARGVGPVFASYYKTEKNKANASFYSNAGFSVVSRSDKETRFCLEGPMPPDETGQIETSVKGEA